MANCVDKKTPLQRSGTSQVQRRLPAMQHGYVNADEKTFADWIVFAQSFAKYLRYFDNNGDVNGDWLTFFNSDVSAVLGTMAVQDVQAYKQSIQLRFDYLKNKNYAGHLPKAEAYLHDVFSAVATLCLATDEFYRLLPTDIPAKAGVENIIKTNLKQPLYRLLSYFKAAKHLGYLRVSHFDNIKVLGQAVQGAEKIFEEIGLSNLWYTGAASWKDFYDNQVRRDESVFGNNSSDVYFSGQYDAASGVTPAQWLQYMKMKHAANHNLFAGIFDQFLSAYSKLVNTASNDLLQTLENRTTHSPHYALFLAFLKLFRFAQNDINSITQRHLDFYYREVLQLTPKLPAANSVHVIVELAKQTADLVLPANTFFKAGKDSEGKEVLYKLVNETSFNKAKVASLRSVFLSPNNLSSVNTNVNNRLYAAPKINSADGIDAELSSANKEWHPLSNLQFSEGEVINVNMPAAQIGFAVASHYLYLQEGERKVMLRLATDNNNAVKNARFQLYITMAKGWYAITSTVDVAVNNNLNNGTETCVEFGFTLKADEPATAVYNAAVHGDNYGVTVPVLKLVLQNDNTSAYDYAAIRDVRINKLQVAVQVGNMSVYSQSGVKQLLVTTESGNVDSSKPFQPFGPAPIAGSRLIVGSREIFTKRNLKLSLHFEWKGLNQSGISKPNPSTDIKQYSKGAWSTWGSGKYLFSNANQFVSNTTEIDNSVIRDFNAPYLSFNNGTVSGFIGVELTAGFGHKAHMVELTKYLIAQSKTPTADPPPSEPYTPVLQSIFVSYSADSDVVNINSVSDTDFEQKAASLIHVYPFGFAEQHAFITKKPWHNLLPQFTHTDVNGAIVHHEGEFYIGFENLAGKQSVNVLFQVLDGSADPRIAKPDNHIQWSFLAGNQWINFNKQDVSDATLQLIQSGIISFTIPAEATISNTILPPGYLWIKAAVAEKTEAIAKLISVDAQAALLSFSDQQNAADFLNNALPAATVSKLKEPLSAIKKVSQPYPSFGGRSAESNEGFYVRVSERLRHKNRAITIWDYEHLILEAFPSVYKVKCLNHTKTNGDYNEVLPGHVTIITIPDLKFRNDINPLKPYTSQAVLKSIEAFLKKRISCHVKLHVANPVFEEVKLTFKLKLQKAFTDFTIYSKKLQEEITGFLSPWAYSDAADISFGGKIYKSQIINFIEERNYVDYITDVQMTHIDKDGTVIKLDNDEIVASTAISILVSVPASKHLIEQIVVQPQNAAPECEWLTQNTASNQ